MANERIIAFIDYIEYMIDAAYYAREAGYKTILIYDAKTEKDVKKELFDYTGPVVNYHVDTLFEQLSKHVDPKKVELVITFSEIGIIPCAALSHKLGLKSNSMETALLTRNKYLMKQTLLQNNVPVANGICIETLDDCKDIRFDFPVILKPLTGSRSFGVQLIHDEQELKSAFYRIKKSNQFSVFSRHGTSEEKNCLLLEEYLEGPEITCDLLFIDGEPYPVILCDKPYYPQGPTFEEQSYCTPSCFDDKIQRSVINTSILAAKALGIQHGPVHVELKITKRGPYVIEIASRMGGCIGQLVKDSMEINYPQAIIESYISPNQKFSFQAKYYAGYGCPHLNEEGTIIDIIGLDKLENIPQLTKIKVKKRVGDVLYKFPLNLGGVITVYARGESEKKVRDIIIGAVSSVTVVLKDKNDQIKKIPLSIQWKSNRY